MNYARPFFWLILLLGPAGLWAQQPLPSLPLKRVLPAMSWAGCPEPTERPAAATAEQRQEGERLAEAATQAALLGDKPAVLDLLTKAANADATAPGIAYRLARALDELDRRPEALAAYCRYLSLAPDGGDAADVRERARVLGTPEAFSVPPEAARAFEAGIYHRDAGKLAEAEVAFGQASQAARTWGDPVFNRAAIRLEQGRTDAAIDDLRRFLELSPGSPEFNTVLDLIGSLRQLTPQYDPGSTLMRGLMLPGLGQFSSGRAGAGALFLGVTAGAAAVGIALTRLSVDCLIPPVDGHCPPGQIAGEKKERPYLIPALAVAAATWVFGAFDAQRAVRKNNGQAQRAGQNEESPGFSMAPPAFMVDLRGARLDLIRLRF